MADNALEQPTRPKSRRRAPRQMKAVLPEPPPASGDEDEDEESWDARAERERRELYAEATPLRRAQSRLPDRWQGITFDDFDDDDRAPALEAARLWSQGKGPRGLLLHGDVGRGKTRIAAAAAWERCNLGPVWWRNVADLLMALSYGFDHPERERAQSMLRPGPKVALVLDDLDKTKPTDHALQPLYMAVNAWVEARQPLLITTNREVDDLAADFGGRFGTPIASRLAGYCEVFEIGGEDWRLGSA